MEIAYENWFLEALHYVFTVKHLKMFLLKLTFNFGGHWSI